MSLPDTITFMRASGTHRSLLRTKNIMSFWLRLLPLKLNHLLCSATARSPAIVGTVAVTVATLITVKWMFV